MGESQSWHVFLPQKRLSQNSGPRICLGFPLHTNISNQMHFGTPQLVHPCYCQDLGSSSSKGPSRPRFQPGVTGNASLGHGKGTNPSSLDYNGYRLTAWAEHPSTCGTSAKHKHSTCTQHALNCKMLQQWQSLANITKLCSTQSELNVSCLITIASTLFPVFKRNRFKHICIQLFSEHPFFPCQGSSSSSKRL